MAGDDGGNDAAKRRTGDSSIQHHCSPQCFCRLRTFAPSLFVLGYLAIWSVFSLAAVLAQFFLEWTTLLSPMMESSSAVLSGILLIGAGIYQFTPLKHSCLRLCRSPLDFLTSHWRSGNCGAFVMGVRHGIYCLGCCWGLVLLLFVGGIMNLI